MKLECNAYCLFMKLIVVAQGRLSVAEDVKLHVFFSWSCCFALGKKEPCFLSVHKVFIRICDFGIMTLAQLSLDSEPLEIGTACLASFGNLLFCLCLSL